MSAINITLLSKREIASGTMQFTFSKPKDFTFRAGQFCDMTLINPPETDDEGNVRGFSIVAAPFEDNISIATRMRDTAFKRVLKNMSEGSEIKFDAPYGSFTLHNNTAKPAVFIIGGIGVTPVRSMIAQATHDKTDHKMTLIHSNKTPDDAPFKDDFQKLASANPNFTFVPVASESAPDNFTGERGYVTADLIKKYVGDFSDTIFYLSGPAGMVKAMREILVNELKADEDNIRTEEFSGY